METRRGQVKDTKLVPAQPGEVHFTWLQPVAEGDRLLSAPYRLAVEAAVREVAQAAAQEEWGWNVVVAPTERDVCYVNRSGVIVVSNGLVRGCMRYSSQPEAALMYSIAHEMGHSVLRHLDEPDLDPTVLRFLLTGAPWIIRAVLQHELEADHFAAAVMLRARVPPATLDEGQRAYVRMRIQKDAAALPFLAQLARQEDAAVGAGSRAGGPSEEQRLLQAIASRDPDRLDRLLIRWEGQEAHKVECARLEEFLRQYGILLADEDADWKAWAAEPAISATIAQRYTHPPILARMERLRQLGARPDMLLRSTAPMLAADGRGLSPAERVADLLAAAAEAEAAAQTKATRPGAAGADQGLRTLLSFAAGAAAVAAAGVGAGQV
ncbi:hypothetical protein ABPG75_000101 [Micractinium tetrahymenae]